MSDSILQRAVEAARRDLSVYWPLHAFAAVNPLWDWIDVPFSQLAPRFGGLTMTVEDYLAYYRSGSIPEQLITESWAELRGACQDSRALPSHSELFNPRAEMPQLQQCRILYCEQIQDLTQADFDAKRWVAEHCYEWLAHFWSNIASTSLQTGSLFVYWQNHYNKRLLKELNPRSNHASAYLSALLETLGVPPSIWTSYLQTIARHLYGWGSLLKWAEQNPDNPWLPASVSLEALFVLWLSFEFELQHDLNHHYSPPSDADMKTNAVTSKHYAARMIWQNALEKSYYQPLMHRLQLAADTETDMSPACKSQIIFCIDVRSERLRRHLEGIEGYETFGCAGFFGFPFQLEGSDHRVKRQCPALLSPKHVLQETSKQHALLDRITKGLANAVASNQTSLLASFALFEIFGLWQSLRLTIKTLLTRHAKVKHEAGPGELDITPLVNCYWDDICDSAYQFLSAMGLVKHFAPRIVICAHQSDTDNNPYAAALDCGACGGNSGSPNAVIMSWILNNQAVRRQLAQKGIEIPEKTQFIPACHHTTTDEISLLTDNGSHHSLLKDLNKAGQLARQERERHLPIEDPARAAHDWAELVPEWGLAGNWAMIIGPRRISRRMDLKGRVFLHSYEPDHDTDGSILEAILTGPMVVAHWINMQYYCSTVNPRLFGAGNKVIHNPVPGVGVMEGNISDLKPGLPLQSIQFQNKLVHTPLRLTVFIQCPESRLQSVLDRNPQVKGLRDNGWLRIKRIGCKAVEETT